MLHPRRNEKVEMGSTWKCNLGCIYYKYIPGVYLPSDNNEMQSLRFLPGRNRQTPPLVGKRTVKDVETDVKLPSPAGGTRVTWHRPISRPWFDFNGNVTSLIYVSGIERRIRTDFIHWLTTATCKFLSPAVHQRRRYFGADTHTHTPRWKLFRLPEYLCVHPIFRLNEIPAKFLFLKKINQKPNSGYRSNCKHVHILQIFLFPHFLPASHLRVMEREEGGIHQFIDGGGR